MHIDSKLPPVFPLCVQNPKNNDAAIFNAVKQLIGKSPREQAAKVTVVKWAALGIGFQLVNGGADFLQPFIAQAGR